MFLPSDFQYDVIIIGAGPAGLAAVQVEKKAGLSISSEQSVNNVTGFALP